MKRYISLLFCLGLMSCEIITYSYVSDRVSSPLVSPVGGVFFENQLIEITCSTPGSTIYYTKDGSIPSRTNGAKYTGRVYVNMFAVVKAVAVAPDLNDSLIVRSAYSFKVSGPTFYKDTGATITDHPVYPADASVTILNSTPESTIYYTIDGSTPTSASNIYTSPLTLSTPMTIKAIALKFGWSYSETLSWNFSFKADPPFIYPTGGINNKAIKVVLTPPIHGSTIHYTLDETTPDSTSPVYTTPLDLTTKTTVKAIAVRQGMQASEVTQGTYSFQTQAVNIHPGDGWYSAAPLVTLDSQQGASIHYTVDGTTPSITSPTYSAPFLVNSSQKIQAIAFLNGYDDSIVTSADYRIENGLTTLGSPTASLASGEVTEPFAAVLSGPEGAWTRYTLDGSIPSANHGQLYESPIQVNGSITVNAISYRAPRELDGVIVEKYYNSPVATWTWTFNANLPTPVITSFTDGQVFSGAAKLEASQDIPGAVIRFTINGVDPTETDSVLSGPVYLASGEKNLVVKIRSYKTGWNPSLVLTQGLSFRVPTPNFNPLPGEYNKLVNIILSQPVLGASTRYTLDGSDPTPTVGTVYQGEILVLESTTTVKAISYIAGREDSPVLSGTFTVTP